MSRIFWDTNLFIYLFEDFGGLSKSVVALRRRMLERGDDLFTSALTLGEILVKPLSRSDAALCGSYEKAIHASANVLVFDARAARRYAAIRHQTSIKAPDAMQLACAAEAEVDLFITNDRRLQGQQVEGIQFIVSLEQTPL